MDDRTDDATTGSPVAVLVHGLWHGAWSWDAVQAALTGRGVDAVAVELPLTDLATDTRVVRDVLDGLGRPAVLVGHSYGGAVITAAGVHPAVRELVYLAAFCLDEGESVSRVLPGEEHPETRLGEALRVDRERGEVALDPELGPALLYPDASPGAAAAAAGRLRPVGRAVFRGTPEAVAWRTVPSTYVVCTADEVVHPALQRAMAARATRRLEWAGGHCPPVSRPDDVAALVAERVAAVAG
ncbi:alpha/beta fold hydrolase [Geodermatophilus marinus]|uniref:alpha/beta fold hydrolase n=1 Tax=Geodermatophilus sp. LHW52908 TaxID=2303986 RepID=UPI001314A670|nr:alpha/beta hydrolase [Geodermatophilus sp. LHW52908]